MQKTLTLRRMTPLTWVFASICSLLAFISISHVLYTPSRSNLSLSNHLATPSGVNTTEATWTLPPEDTDEEELQNRPLILYVYSESVKPNSPFLSTTNATTASHQNIRFFINHGLHAEADFIFILNGPTTIEPFIPTHKPNVRIVRRENTCFDLGAYADVLLMNDGALMKKYKRFIMMNGSVRGPFMPSWSRECWSDALLAKITDTNKLVGISYNCRKTRHIQSMLLATDITGLTLIMPRINQCFTTFMKAIGGEISITGAVTEKGYNVTALMTSFQSAKDYAQSCRHGDMLLNNRYFNITMHPLETMFQKANRGMAPQVLERFTEWIDGSGYESWGVCRRAKNVRRVVREMKKRGVDLDFGV
ncbi:hypothetical protein TWF506_004689 [Arthrobotrys conoides]|uniref:Uncharacterized protein n=1 Tax=Arthrobotrys conoides TaxID=74498 RepID=A0AAN8N2I0_9PEZI